MNPRAALVTALVGAAGLGLFWFVRGPVRSWFGDVLVIVFLVGAMASVGALRPWQRLAAIGALALGTEAFQGLGIVPKDAPWWVHLTVGATFDPWDFAAYAVGLGVAAGLEAIGYGSRTLRG